MLSPLQRQVAEVIASLKEADGFALAGGAALIVRGDIQRGTRDLDFFGLSTEAVDRLLPAIEEALHAADLAVERVQVNPGFARLIVSSDKEQTELDLGADARLFAVEAGNPAPTLRSEELAVDKVLAVFGRAEARDFADLMVLEPRYGLDRLFDLAAVKDRGFLPSVFVEMLDRFRRLRRDEFDLDDRGYAELCETIVRWRLQADELARRAERPHQGEPDG